MKTFIIFFAAILAFCPTVAQNYYKDGALIKINDDLTFQCGVFRSFIGLRSTKNYPIDQYGVATVIDRYAIKRAFEETFTADELQKYRDRILNFSVIHDGKLKPVDIDFVFQEEVPENTISPIKFAILRQKLLDYLKFKSNFKLNPQSYYVWDENIVAPLSYYLQSK